MTDTVHIPESTVTEALRPVVLALIARFLTQASVDPVLPGDVAETSFQADRAELVLEVTGKLSVGDRHFIAGALRAAAAQLGSHPLAGRLAATADQVTAAGADDTQAKHERFRNFAVTLAATS